MSIAYKTFLRDKRTTPNQASIALAGYGKHPGWYDHIEGLGEITPSLMMVKAALYTDGIGSIIDSGAWESLYNSEDTDTPQLKHTFVWQRENQTIIGKLWPSKDKAGRSHYPMIVCAHCINLPLSNVFDSVLPILENIKQDCLATKSADAVKEIINKGINDLKTIAKEKDLTSQEQLFPERPPAVFDDYLKAENNQATFQNILYQLSYIWKEFSPAQRRIGFGSAEKGCETLRLPMAVAAKAALPGWLWFTRTQIESDAPVLLCAPEDHGWCDIIVGNPDSEDLVCLRENTTPIAADSAMDATTAAKTQTALDTLTERSFQPPTSIFAVGKVSAPQKAAPVKKKKKKAAPPPPVAETTPASTPKKGVMVLIPVFAIVMVLAAAAIYVAQKNPPKQKAIAQNEPAKAEVSQEPQVSIATPAAPEKKPEVKVATAPIPEKAAPEPIATPKVEVKKPEPKPEPISTQIAETPKAPVVEKAPPAPKVEVAQKPIIPEAEWKAYKSEWEGWLQKLKTDLENIYGKEWLSQEQLKSLAESVLQNEAIIPDNIEALPHATIQAGFSAAQKAVDDIKRSIQLLPTWGQLTTQAESFQKLGNINLSKQLKKLAQPPAFNAQLANTILERIHQSNTVKPVILKTREFKKKVESFTSEQSPQFEKLWDIYTQTLAKAKSLEAFDSTLAIEQKHFENLNSYLQENWGQKIDTQRLAEQTKNAILTTKQDLSNWLDIAKQNTILGNEEDPRTSSGWQTSINILRNTQQQLKTITDETFRTNANKTIAALNAQLDQLKNTPAVLAYREQLQQQTAILSDKINTLKDELHGAMLKNIEGWLTYIRTLEFTDIDLQKAWEKQRSAALNNYNIENFKENSQLYQSLNQKFQKYTQSLEQLTASNKLPPLELPLNEYMDVAFYNAVNSDYKIERTDRIASTVPGLDDAASLDSIQFKNFEEEIIQPRVQLIQIFSTLKKLLAALNTDMSPYAQLLDQIRKNRFTAQYQDKKLFSNVLQEVLRLEQISKWQGTDPLSMLTVAAQNRYTTLESIMAYQKLEAIQWIPQTIKQLESAIAVGQVLQERIEASTATPKTQTKLKQAIEAYRKNMWWNYANRAAPTEYTRILSMANGLGMSFQQLSQEFQTKYHISQSLAQLRDAPKSEVSQIQNKLIATLQQIQQTQPSNATQSLLTTLQSLNAGKGVELDKLGFKGPAKMSSWAATSSPDGSTVTFQHKSKPELSLEFKLFADSQQPFYLTTHEISVAFFFDTLKGLKGRVNATPGIKEWYNKIKNNSSLRGFGPYNWQIKKGELLVHNPDYPMQQIPPKIAESFAKLLTCRLPAIHEWEAIQASYFSSLDTVASREWNTGYANAVPSSSPSRQPATFNDGYFEPVNHPRQGANGLIPFPQIIGNVAEFYKGNNHTYIIAGGSVLSSRSPLETLEVPPQRSGFPDVGFRLAFNAPATLSLKVKLKQALEKALRE